MLEEREQLDVLGKDLNKKREEVEAAMNTISGEREQLNQMKTSTDKERRMLDKEKDRVEGERSELKIREGEFLNKMKSVESRREKLQQLNERMQEDMRKKMERLQTNNEDVVMLYAVLEQKLTALDVQRENMARCTELLEGERKLLKTTLSDMVIQREENEHQWKQKSELDKQDLNKLKAELKQDREDLDRESETMNKEKLDLELMRSDILKQRDILEQEKQDVKDERNNIEITNCELQKKTEHVDSQFDEINREKSNIKDLTLQLQTERDKLENVMKTNTLKQEAQELKEDEFKRLTQELETSKNSVLAEREELDVFRKDLNKKREEVEAAMNTISGDREQLNQRRSSTDMDRPMLDNEKDRMEGERSELKIREDQLLNKMKSVETLREKLQQLNERMSEDMKKKMEKLQTNNEDVVMLYTMLEQKLTALDVQRENIAHITELLEGERKSLKTILSDMVIQREDMEHQWKQKFELDKQDLNKLEAELKQDRKDLDRESEMMNKEKLDLELMRSDILKQRDMLEQEKQDVKEERGKLEITKRELQKKTEHADSQFDEINREKEQPHQMKTTISEREMLNEMKRMEGELSEMKIREDRLTRLMKSMGNLRSKLNQLNQRRHEIFTNNMDRLGQKYEDILQLNSILQHKGDELEKQKNKITGYYDLIEKVEKHMVTLKFDKAVQTEVVKVWPLEQDAEEQYLNKLKEFEREKVVLVSDVAIQTDEVQGKSEGDEHDLERKGKYLKTEREGLLTLTEDEEVKNEPKQKLAVLPESASEQDDSTHEEMSKRDCLRKIWKDTKMERKEIDQMKRKSHEKRNNLEKRLSVINQFVKRTWLQKEKEPLEKKLKQGVSKDMTFQNDSERDRTTLDEKYTELQQLKVQMLSEIDKLCVKEKVSRTLTTSDKANQTTQVDMTTGDQEQEKVEETEAAPETSSGLLGQLRHYCRRCCCQPCACCKQVCNLS